MDQARIQVYASAQKFDLVYDVKRPDLYYLIDSTGVKNSQSLTLDEILKQGRNIGYYADLPPKTGLHKALFLPKRIAEVLKILRQQGPSTLLDKSLNR